MMSDMLTDCVLVGRGQRVRRRVWCRQVFEGDHSASSWGQGLGAALIFSGVTRCKFHPCNKSLHYFIHHVRVNGGKTGAQPNPLNCI